MSTPTVTVLIVDDDPQLVRALRINLTAHGYQVLTAPDGTTALEVAADTNPTSSYSTSASAQRATPTRSPSGTSRWLS